MNSLFIYFDEYGHFSPNLDKDGSFSHFIYCGLTFNSKGDKENFESRANSIIQRQFNGNLFKSKNLNSNSRHRILENLTDLNWNLTVFVVDQSKLTGALSEYKRTFIKFIQRAFLSSLTKNYDSYHIVFDETGSSEFKSSLVNYMQKHTVNPDLFNQERSYEMSNEKRDRNILLCFTDLFANSLGQFYCKSHYRQESVDFLNKIIGRLHVQHFPFQSIYENDSVTIIDSTSDKIIKEISFAAGNEVISQLNLAGSKQECQVLLAYFLLVAQINSDRLIPLTELTDHLHNYFMDIGDDKVRLIINDIRNMGVMLISSKGRGGYKLATCLSDFDAFFKRYLDSIVPMIGRIDQNQNIVKLRTRNEIDIISSITNSELLSELVNIYKKFH